MQSRLRISISSLCVLLLGLLTWLSAVQGSLTDIPLGGEATTIPTIDGVASPDEWTDTILATETIIADDGSLQDQLGDPLRERQVSLYSGDLGPAKDSLVNPQS